MPPSLLFSSFYSFVQILLWTHTHTHVTYVGIYIYRVCIGYPIQNVVFSTLLQIVFEFVHIILAFKILSKMTV